MEKTLIILCGGLSTRMGCDKTFLPFGSTSLVNYQIERFRPFFNKIYLSVPSHTDRPEYYESRCGCPAIEDLCSKTGPMGGLYSCLKTLPDEILFFISVDAPFTDPRLAVTLCDRLETAGDLVYACAIQDPCGQIQPLFAAWHKKCLPTLEQQLSQKNYRLRDLLTREHTLILDQYFPQDQYFNMNDPATYYSALRRLADRNPAVFPPDSGFRPRIPLLSFTARSGSGKTTYLEKLIPLLCREGLRIAVIKHDAHGFQIDKPGKDSYRLTRAGATHMILTSKDQTAAVITHPGCPQRLGDLAGRIENADLILTEGYKFEDQEKIYLLRKGYQETPPANVKNIIAYVTDFPLEASVPVFDLNQPEQIVPFLTDYISWKQ